MSVRSAGASAAVQAALAKVQRHAGTTALAAVLAPLALGMASSAAQAVVSVSPLPGVTITGTVVNSIGSTRFNYGVSNNTATGTLDAFEIPEVSSADLSLASFIGPEGWSAALEGSRSLPGTGFKSGSVLPNAFILVSTNRGLGISEGSSASFSFSTTESGTISANFGATLDNGNSSQSGYVDPPVPGGPVTATVPEPASMLILGGAMLATGVTRMRRKG